MKTPWVIGIVAGAHVLAVAGIMVIQGCGTTQGTIPETGGVVMPPSAVAPEAPPVVPPSPPKVTEWPPASSTEYVIKKGDSLSKIAARFGLSTRELTALNGIDNPNKIRVGQKITLPGKKDIGASDKAPAPAAAAAQKASASKPVVASSGNTYVVKSGDCVSKIASAHNCTTKALMEANQMKDAKILVGQKLVLPAGASAKATIASTIPAPAKKPAPTVATPSDAAAPVPVSLDSAPVELPDPEAAPVITGSMREHIVGDDEDLPRIAMRYGVTVTRLKEVNSLIDGTVRPGQKVMIPIDE